MVAQKSPDGGKSDFWYDRLGRLAISQNARQYFAGTTENNQLYSYTLYDFLGRITEVGEIKNNTTNVMTSAISRSTTQLDTWIQNSVAWKLNATRTFYDAPYDLGVNPPIIQRNLRNRVSYTSITLNSAVALYNQATFYDYDVHGHVKQLLQDYGRSDYSGTVNMMNSSGNRFKSLYYKYDLISGKVNGVYYQPDFKDTWQHEYDYDAENRITAVKTSADGYNWETEARYNYYKHGPLARTTLGDQLVQGIDYAYTLQGWLKGVNSINLSPDNDMGNDGKLAAPNQYVARDAFGFSLNYFAADYKAINNMVRFPEPMGYFPALQYRPLYNGNISSMAESNDKLSTAGLFGGKTLLYNYKYDQLNRITGMDTYNGFNTASNNWNGMVKLDQLQEKVSYDGNGNIQGYLRHGHLTGSNLVMDSLTYKYDTLNQRRNRLLRVVDNVPATRYGTYADLDPQTKPINYVYDPIGNLISDSAESINSIKWNVYGKISEINRTSTTGNTVTKIVYTYDASGNRISSVTTRSGTSNLDYVWYVRDAQGNAIAVYKATGTSTLSTLTPVLAERYIYGSSRLGSYNEQVSVTGGAAALSGIYSFSNRRGLKNYELSNHLGNVLATISDKKIGVPAAGNSSLIGYYTADVTNATSYYPFGSIMPGRSWSNGGKYRYGFNGKENDNNVKNADGTQQDYGMRIYDPRVGRFLSEDPLTRGYPWYTPYQFAGNTPIQAIDLDGAEPKTAGKEEGQVGKTEDYVGTGPGGFGKQTNTWIWHGGSEEYGTNEGWYNSKEYAEVMKPIARDLAGFQGKFNGVPGAGHNWTDLEKANVANTSLGKFIMSGLSKSAEEYLVASADLRARDANFQTTGTVQPSGFNVEDMLVAGIFIGQGLKVFSGITSIGMRKTGTVWDDIVPTQPNYPGSILPKSFELNTREGSKVWVHGNASEHIAEFIKMKAKNYTPGSVRLATQIQLSSLQSAVNAATKNGIKFNERMKIGGWELKFAEAKSPGLLPVLNHAQPY